MDIYIAAILMCTYTLFMSLLSDLRIFHGKWTYIYSCHIDVYLDTFYVTFIRFKDFPWDQKPGADTGFRKGGAQAAFHMGPT